MAKKIIFGEEARAKILRGVNAPLILITFKKNATNSYSRWLRLFYSLTVTIS